MEFRLSLTFVLVAATVVGAVTPLERSPATASNGYDITVDNSTDLPPRTLTFGGQRYNISAVANADLGDELRVSVSTSDTSTYRLLLYNADRQIVDSWRGTESSTFSVPLEVSRTGSFVLSVHANGIHQTIHPVLVRRYLVELNAPPAAERGATERLEVTMTRVGPGDPPAWVEVVVLNDTTTVRTSARITSEGTHTLSVPFRGLNPGDYRVIATVRGPREAFDENELLGISDPSPIRILTPTGDEPTRQTSRASSGEEPTSTSVSPDVRSTVITPIEPPNQDSPSGPLARHPDLKLWGVIGVVIVLVLLALRRR